MEACTKSCRFPGGTVERIEQAAEERDLLESEVFRQAVRHYIRANPDEFAAFSDASKPSEARVSTVGLGKDDLTEPVEERGDDPRSPVEEDGGEDAFGAGVYDPTKEGE